MSKEIKFLRNILLVTLVAWISFTIVVFLHEWTHGLLAWWFGYKDNPFDIIYGGLNVHNILWQGVDQNVNDFAIAFIGHPYLSGIILIVPLIIVNGGLGFLSIFLLKHNLNKNKVSRVYLLFLYFFILWNIGEFYSYTCLRSFSTHADVGLFLDYFQLSPWCIFIPGLYLSLYAFNIILGSLNHKFFDQQQLALITKNIAHFAACLLLFVFPVYISTGWQFSRFGPVVEFVSILSIAVLPLFLYLYRPKAAEHDQACKE
jgi:hypothetical protein